MGSQSRIHLSTVRINISGYPDLASVHVVENSRIRSADGMTVRFTPEDGCRIIPGWAQHLRIAPLYC